MVRRFAIYIEKIDDRYSNVVTYMGKDVKHLDNLGREKNVRSEITGFSRRGGTWKKKL